MNVGSIARTGVRTQTRPRSREASPNFVVAYLCWKNSFIERMWKKKGTRLEQDANRDLPGHRHSWCGFCCAACTSRVTSQPRRKPFVTCLYCPYCPSGSPTLV
eukprot:9476669-Pyramimonas_sp.AAC.1